MTPSHEYQQEENNVGGHCKIDSRHEENETRNTENIIEALDYRVSIKKRYNPE